MAGDARRAARLYAALVKSEPGNDMIAARAVSQAIAAGDLALALRLARGRPAGQLAIDARLALVADELARGRGQAAEQLLQPVADGVDLSFLLPAVRAWRATEANDLAGALRHLDAVPAQSGLAPHVAEQRAFILLRFRRVADAAPVIERALASAGGRERGLRIAFADGYVRAGARGPALALLGATDPVTIAARRRIESGDQLDAAVLTAASAFADLLLAFAFDINRPDEAELPIAMAQIGRRLDPRNPQAPIVLSMLLAADGRSDDALAAVRSVSEQSLFAPQARDAEIRVLIGTGRKEEALARAQAWAANTSSVENHARLGDVLDSLGRHLHAAAAYGEAVRLAEQDQAPDRWTLYLLRGGALEQADRWAEAETMLEKAHGLAPNNPIVLNYLGYARLERGEQVAEAEALIARASSLAPDDASITDSLGWAQFKRGKVQEAIGTLQRAAVADPGQAEIHEHLGDALYTAGRKYEARFAWRAALVTAENEVRTRVEAKIDTGLNSGNAAP
jgi:Flp pilus assembly protein TadD